MDTHRNADDAVTSARKADPAPPDQITDRPLAPAATPYGEPAGEFTLPANPIVRFFTAHPIGFWFFFWGEFAERCSYYGMRAILALYMIDKLGLTEANASTYNSIFIAACYFLPLAGGYVADRWFGKYWTIVGFSIPYILGHVILGVENFWFMVAALSLLAMGSGVIKPNISTLMGLTYDQQRPGLDKLRSDGFAMFYFSINVGAALSQLAMPKLRDWFDYRIAFLFPAALMVLSFAIFAAGKRFYATETVGYKSKTPAERIAQWAVLKRIFGLFVLVMFFWAIFDQASSTWILFGNLYMDCRLFGYKVDPDAIQAANPIFIIVFLPLMQVLWRVLDRNGVKVRPTDKMIAGFVLTAVTLGIMAGAAAASGPVEPDKRPKINDATGQVEMKDGQPVMEEWVKDEHKVTVWWEVLAFLVITISEILISVTGLELAYAAAPKSMTGFVTACWLATVGAANFLINTWSGFLYEKFTPTQYFSGLATTLLIVAGGFFFVARQFNRANAQAEQIPLTELKDDARFAGGDGQTDVIEGEMDGGITGPRQP